MFADIGLIVTAIMGAVFFTLLLLTGNTMAQAVRERIPELAVLKTIGFTDATVLVLVLAESVLLIVLAGCLGLAIAQVLMPGISKGLGRRDPAAGRATGDLGAGPGVDACDRHRDWALAGAARDAAEDRRCLGGAIGT
jgi:ABC-type antimicrobial peptide transport system permease subunit